MWNNLHAFYCSKEFRDIKTQLMLNKGMRCDHCHKLIFNRYDSIAHHTVFLNMSNVNDYNISLNLDLLQLVHRSCHNEIHNRFGSYTPHRYLVYGSPCSGKEEYVKSIATKDDLVICMDKIRFAISGGLKYESSNYLTDDVFAVRNLLLDRVKVNATKARNIFIIGSYPYKGERERLCATHLLEPIHIDTSKEECLLRLEKDSNRDSKEFKKYIEDYFYYYS